MILHRTSRSAAASLSAVATVLVLTLTLSDAAAGASLAGLDRDDLHSVANRFADLIADESSSPGDADDRQYFGSRDVIDGGLNDDDVPESTAMKRKWGQKNMALWGKRGHSFDGISGRTSDVIKRKWGQKNMALWGKRSGFDDISTEKRKWGQKNMALWGRK